MAILVLLIVTRIESRQARELAGKQPYAPAITSASRTVVVYFSRSGNTAVAARHIAMRLYAQLFPLEAPAYRLGPGGLTNALKDANALKDEPEALPEIIPRTIEFMPFDSVWLGSPVWLHSPAPPIWAFVEHNRFEGKHVVLFNTFNSHFGDDHISQAEGQSDGAWRQVPQAPTCAARADDPANHARRDAPGHWMMNS